jgi:membrane peptidoglycan carboxypeptidase
MRAAAGTRFSVTARRGRWTRPVTGRADRDGQWSALTAVLTVAVLVLATIAGFAWASDRQLRGGILAQRAEAAQRPDWISLTTLPDYIALAFVVAVDPTFLQRSPLATGVEGSTLSRELARQVHQLRGNLAGEARELVMGPLLEARLSNAQLLELYLNRVYLGMDQGWPIYGIYHAAREYFEKEPQQLTLGEAATLAGLLLPPRIVHPRQQAGAVGIRRNEVLRQMLAAEAISVEEYNAALQEPLAFQPGLEFEPMTRPLGWDREPEVIRLPPEALTAPEPEPAP